MQRKGAPDGILRIAARRESMTDPPDRGRTLRRLSVTALAFLAGLASAEVALRLFWPAEVDTQILAKSRAPLEFGVIKRYSSDPVLYYELIPDRRFKCDKAKFVIDSEGFRVSDQPIVHAPDVTGAPVRFALVGPSTAYGWRVPFASCYGEQLRRRLEARWKRPVELRDFGVPAYNATQETRLFETKVLAWHPDFVVWNYDHRDAYPLLNADDSVGAPPEFGDNPLHSALVKLLRRRLRERDLERRRFRHQPFTQTDNYLTSGCFYDEHLAALERMAARAQREHLPVVLFIHDVVMQPLPDGAEHFEKLHEPLLAFFAAKTPNLHVVDLFPRFQQVMAERGWSDLKPWWISVTPQDAHPNDEGHAFVAEELDRFIATLPEIGPAR
jgi:hypothetical protein